MDESTTTYPDVHVELVGEDGNAMAIISRVARVIKRAHGEDAAGRFVEEAMDQKSYDELLQFVMRTVEVS